MLREISREIETELRARDCSYAVVYGPERLPSSVTNCRIVVERERGTVENASAPKSRAPNPRMVAVRAIAGRCRIFAKSSVPGANVWDHEREADLATDLFVVALHAVVRRRLTECRVTSGKILPASELEYQQISAWPGVVYELSFEVNRGVYDTTWAGEKRPSVEVGGTSGISITNAITAGGDPSGSNSLPSVNTRVE